MYRVNSFLRKLHIWTGIERVPFCEHRILLIIIINNLVFDRNRELSINDLKRFRPIKDPLFLRRQKQFDPPQYDATKISPPHVTSFVDSP